MWFYVQQGQNMYKAWNHMDKTCTKHGIICTMQVQKQEIANTCNRHYVLDLALLACVGCSLEAVGGDVGLDFAVLGSLTFRPFPPLDSALSYSKKTQTHAATGKNISKSRKKEWKNKRMNEWMN